MVAAFRVKKDAFLNKAKTNTQGLPPTDKDDYFDIKISNNIPQLTSKLVARGLSNSLAQDIALRAMYIDDAIGGNSMTSILNEITTSSKFKNPEDLVDNLNNVFSGNNVNSTGAKNLVKEFEEGKYWINQGEEVYISKKWTANTNEVDVTIITKNAIVECKNVTGNDLRSNVNLIISKFTEESKLSSAIKHQYPNHYGKISISNT